MLNRDPSLWVEHQGQFQHGDSGSKRRGAATGQPKYLLLHPGGFRAELGGYRVAFPREKQFAAG